MAPPAPALQEHPERLPGAGGHLGSEPRAAAQVHHAGHGHHAEAGEVAPGLRGLSSAWEAAGTAGSQPRVGTGWSPAPELGLFPICWGPRSQHLGPPVTPLTPPPRTHVLPP